LRGRDKRWRGDKRDGARKNGSTALHAITSSARSELILTNSWDFDKKENTPIAD
jgi:hypothetical protein